MSNSFNGRDPFTSRPASEDKPGQDPFEKLVQATTPSFSELQASPAQPLPSAPQRYAARLPAATFKKQVDRRVRPRAFMYRNIPPELHQRVKRRAAEVEVPVGELVRFFFEQGLRAWETQQLPLRPQLRPSGLTLYPDEARPRRRKGTGKSRQHVVAYRGIPAQLHDALGAVATRLDVPRWQIARQFMEFGLAHFSFQQLKQHTQPSPQVTRTLYPGEAR